MNALRSLLAVLVLAAPVLAQESFEGSTTEELLRSAEHANPAVRVRAVEELGRRRGPQVLIALLARLRDEDAPVRARAAEALRAMGDERAVPHLARVLEDEDETVRARAVLALGDLGGRYIVPTLARHLEDPSCLVRAASLRALGEVGDPLVLDLLLRAQRAEKEDRGFSVTAAALIAAAKLGGPTGLAASLEIAEPKLPQSWFVRASAAHAVGLARDRGRAPFLAKLLAEDPDPRVCQAAAGALAALPATNRLLAALRLETGFRRRAAVAGLAAIDAQDVLAPLIGATKDPDPGVALEAGAALLARGEAEAFPVLIALLDRPEPSVWLGALEVLGRRTGLSLGRNPPAWKRWFEESREALSFDAERGVFEAVR